MHASPPSLHLNSIGHPFRVILIIVAANLTSKFVSPMSIDDKCANHRPTEETIPQRNLRSQRELVQIVTGPLPCILYPIHPSFERQTDILVEMNNRTYPGLRRGRLGDRFSG